MTFFDPPVATIDLGTLGRHHAGSSTLHPQAGAMTMDWDLRPLRAQDLELSEVTDGFVVSRRDQDRIHFLNPTAAFILEICDGNLQARELPDLVAAAFRLDSPPVGDVETCLGMLLKEGLVVRSGARARTAG